MRTVFHVMLILALAAGPVLAQDWPQLQHDPARTGFVQDGPGMNLHARWIWMGPDHILRNSHAEPDNPAFDDDLASEEGKNMPMPESVSFSFAESMQPIVADGRVFVADCQGQVYAIDADDGSTLWTSPLPGGSVATGVTDGQIVAFASVLGIVRGYRADTGEMIWQVDTGSAITGAPALVDGVIYTANHRGHVLAIDLDDGAVAWTSEDLGAPVQGGLCVAEGTVYTGTEACEAVALDAATGQVLARQKLMGQGFINLWPVAAEGRIIFVTVPAIAVGSEFINDPILSGDPDRAVGWEPDLQSGYPDAEAEQEAVREWLAGDGRWWETTFALDPGTLAQDYTIATGVTEGCGTPPNPPTLDAQGRPIVWWASAYGTIKADCGFGTNLAVDLSTFDLETGDRIFIDNGRLASGQTTETDNLYAISIGGPYAYLRQNFRGTSVIDLTTSRHARISAQYRRRDGGGWQSPIVYAQGEYGGIDDFDVRVPSSPTALTGRVAPAIANNRLYFTETFGLTCAQPR